MTSPVLLGTLFAAVADEMALGAPEGAILMAAVLVRGEVSTLDPPPAVVAVDGGEGGELIHELLELLLVLAPAHLCEFAGS